MSKKTVLEYRYYSMPSGEYILPLYGEQWRIEYGIDTGDTQHFHNFYEIGYCHEGEGEVRIEDRTFPYEGGMYTLIPAHVPHTTKSKAGGLCLWSFLFLDIEGFLRDRLQMDAKRRTEIIQSINHRGTIKTMKNHPQIGRLVLKIIREFEEKSAYYEEAIQANLYELIIEMLRLDTKNTGEIQGIYMNSCIENALDFIESHYAEDLKVSSIATACGLSESYFRRIFRETMSLSPADYLNFVRIERACTLLNEQNLSMEEIGIAVGYQTPSTFNRNFKKITGMQPTQWKRNISGHRGRIADFKVNVLKGWGFK